MAAGIRKEGESYTDYRNRLDRAESAFRMSQRGIVLRENITHSDWNRKVTTRQVLRNRWRRRV